MAGAVVPVVTVMITHLLALTMIVLMIIWTFGLRGGLGWSVASYQGIYNFHPLFMLLGFIFLFGEAIQAYRVFPGTKFQRKLIHAVLNGIGLGFAIAGVYFVWLYHDYTGDPHLTSIHAWFGMATVVFFAVQWIAGLILFLVPVTPADVKKTSLPIHVLAGICLFLMVLLVSNLGILEKLTFLTDADTITRRGADTLIGNFIAIFILLWGGFVLYMLVYADKEKEEGKEDKGKLPEQP